MYDHSVVLESQCYGAMIRCRRKFAPNVFVAFVTSRPSATNISRWWASVQHPTVNGDKNFTLSCVGCRVTRIFKIRSDSQCRAVSLRQSSFLVADSKLLVHAWMCWCGVLNRIWSRRVTIKLSWTPSLPQTASWSERLPTSPALTGRARPLLPLEDAASYRTRPDDGRNTRWDDLINWL